MAQVKIIAGTDFLRTICDAINVDFNAVRRVVLDVSYNEAVFIYVEQLGTDKLLNINMQSDGIKLSEISVVKKVGNVT
jgi:hypothetical protein